MSIIAETDRPEPRKMPEETPLARLSHALAPQMAEVDTLMRQRMVSAYVPRIADITGHLFNSGGKRIRPLLTLASAGLFGYEGRKHLLLAATVEFIHAATLLHDDVVDESDKRRGKPTANRLWDNSSSVLVGDYLFSRAFQMMVETDSLKVLDILANASATIAEGEVLQLTAAKDISTSEDTYLKIIRGKTAALFSAATRVGAEVATDDARAIDAMYKYGDAIGIAFQIADDLLDYAGTDEIGKSLGDDFRERKLSLPVIRSIAASGPEGRAFWERTIGKGEQGDGDFEYAQSLMQSQGVIADIRASALEWSGFAKAQLEMVPECALTDDLRDLADFVVARVR